MSNEPYITSPSGIMVPNPDYDPNPPPREVVIEIEDLPVVSAGHDTDVVPRDIITACAKRCKNEGEHCRFHATYKGGTCMGREGNYYNSDGVLITGRDGNTSDYEVACLAHWRGWKVKRRG